MRGLDLAAPTPVRRDACGCAVVRRTVSDYLSSDLPHGGSLDGATAIGQATAQPRLVARIGTWLSKDGRITRARWKASTCPALIAFSEVACELLEAGVDPAAISAPVLRAHLGGVHPMHRDRAEVVAAALRSALDNPTPPGGPP